VDLAQAYDIPVVLNPAPAQPLSRELLSQVDYLTPNEHELTLLADEEDIDRAIEKLRGWGVRSLIITMGARGARVVTQSIDEHLPAHEITAVDTTAAGDAFNGALGVALAEGNTLLTSVRYAMAAGALAATKRGAQPSLPTRESVEGLINR
jgi:ribokinase